MSKKDHVYNHAHNHECNYNSVDYQQIVYGNTASPTHGFTIDYGKFILITLVPYMSVGSPS